MLLTELINPNAYFVVLKKVKVWAMKGYEPSNHYWGSARINTPKYEPLELEADDEIHFLHGGMFGIETFGDASGKAVMIMLEDPKNKDIDWKQRKYMEKPTSLETLVNDGSIKKIPNGQETKVAYR